MREKKGRRSRLWRWRRDGISEEESLNWHIHIHTHTKVKQNKAARIFFLDCITSPVYLYLKEVIQWKKLEKKKKIKMKHNTRSHQIKENKDETMYKITIITKIFHNLYEQIRKHKRKKKQTKFILEIQGVVEWVVLVGKMRNKWNQDRNKWAKEKYWRGNQWTERNTYKHTHSQTHKNDKFHHSNLEQSWLSAFYI